MSDLYTPGPWEMREGKSAHVAIYQQGTNHAVAIGVHPKDAPVVTAAPDLLDACRGLLRALNIAFDRAEGDLMGAHHNDAVDAMNAAEVAIAKVEGRT